MVIIRVLAVEDAVQYRALRIRALREHPEAYGATLESMEKQPIDDVAERLRRAERDGYAIFGAFDHDALIGLAALGHQLGNTKRQHRAGVFQMYVAPEARGRKVGRELLLAAIERARSYPEVEEVTLAVTVGNQAARNLYLNTGFVPSHIEPRYLKIDGIYYDIEWMRLRLVRGD